MDSKTLITRTTHGSMTHIHHPGSMGGTPLCAEAPTNLREKEYHSAQRPPSLLRWYTQVCNSLSQVGIPRVCNSLSGGYTQGV